MIYKFPHPEWFDGVEKPPNFFRRYYHSMGSGKAGRCGGSCNKEQWTENRGIC